MNGVTLPPHVTVHKDRIAGQWVYTFRHDELGRLGRIVLQTRSDGNTQLNCELAGEPDDPTTKKRALIFEPLALEVTEKAQMATGGPPPNRVLDEPVSPRTMHQIATKHMKCNQCDADVAFLIFADRARSVGELEDYARMMHNKVVELDVATWVISEPVGNDPPPERPADIIKIWPERGPVQRHRPSEFNPLIDELMETHCRVRSRGVVSPSDSHKGTDVTVEKPCSPGHSLGMLNAHMQTDILRRVHQGVEERRKQSGRKSPLENFIESIRESLETFEGRKLFGSVRPNPFQTDPRYPFEAELAYRHDIELLKSQLGSLEDILAELNDR